MKLEFIPDHQIGIPRSPWHLEQSLALPVGQKHLDNIGCPRETLEGLSETRHIED